MSDLFSFNDIRALQPPVPRTGVMDNAVSYHLNLKLSSILNYCRRAIENPIPVQ